MQESDEDSEDDVFVAKAPAAKKATKAAPTKKKAATPVDISDSDAASEPVAPRARPGRAAAKAVYAEIQLSGSGSEQEDNSDDDAVVLSDGDDSE